MIIISIDPGQKGWMFAMDENRNEISSEPMPLRENGMVCGGAISDWLTEVLDIMPELDGDIDDDTEYDCLIYVEDVHAIFGSAAGATFNFGRAVEAIHTAIECVGFEPILVQPKEWQKIVWGKAQRIMDEKKVDTKATSTLVAMDLFPDTDLRKSSRARKPHDGKVDAMLIAEYGRIKYLQKDLVD